MTPTQAATIVNTSTRCTQATMRAFGIEGSYPLFGSACLEYLKVNGFTYAKILGPKRLKAFIRCNPKGMFLIFTKGHAMALVDGILVDTGNTSPNKEIEFVWEVRRQSN